MFTGADFLKRFNAVFDTTMNGIIPTNKLNQQIAEAQTEYFLPMFKAYGLNNTINAELEPLIESVSIANPSSNLIIISSDLPNYFIPISLETTFIDNGNTYTKTAQPLPPNSMIGSFTSGIAIYPRYSVSADTITLYPQNKVCSNCNVTYFRTQYLIDITDNTTIIPYNDDTLSGIIDQLASIYSLSLGDNRYPAFEREERENTKVIIK